MNSHDLTDRTPDVTGASQGIGLTVASCMLASGVKVAIRDREGSPPIVFRVSALARRIVTLRCALMEIASI